MKKEKMIIALDSCNGEEKQFKDWMGKNHPEIETSIENTLDGGLYEWNEEFQEWQLTINNYWEEYCNE